MNKEQSLEEVLSNIDFMQRLYDIIRIVDPYQKKTFKIENKKVEELQEPCFSFWNSCGSSCANCIAARAYNENSTFIKFEYDGTRVYMITAVPIEIEDRLLILELLKDVTDTSIVDEVKNRSKSQIYSILEHKNRDIVKDPLSNLFNKRFIYEQLPYEIYRSVTEKTPLSIIMTDIDFFKKVNDKYGHIAGDVVIKEFGKILDSCTQDKGWCARFGGEEFLICCPNIELNEARAIAEMARQKVEEVSVKYNEGYIKITASFGISSISEEGLDVDSFIERADKKLYEAKRSGRNKVV